MEVERVIVGEYKANCYIINSDNDIAIIDPGDEVIKIVARIDREENKTRYIILTHYHPDHTGSAVELKKITGGEILIHKLEKPYIGFSANRILRERDLIKIGKENLKVIHTPGHSPGSICLLGEKEIFTGDTLFSDGHGRIDLPGGSETDMQASLARLKRIIKPGTIVYPGHGKEFEFVNL